MINLLNKKKSDHHVNLFSSTLKQNITTQAASMLLQYVKFQKKFYHLTQNINTNAFDERHHIRRTNKCNSWLSKFSTKSDTSRNRGPIFIESPSYKFKSPTRFHHNQLTLSSNATSNINSQFETSSQPFIMIHKKRLHRDYFLSTMQNCIQPPYSQNHFYAFDQLNMLKLQRNFHRNNYFNSKRKYSEIYGDDDDDEPEHISSEIDLNQGSPSKKHNISPPKTADHISINKYHDEIESPFMSDEKFEIEKQESQVILSRLEKILNLCGELRSLANDVENYLIEKQSINEKNHIEKSESDQIIIDIYKELEIQQVIDDINEKDAPPIYQTMNDASSVHSESIKSHQLMQTESFKTKSPSLTTSHTTLRKPEDICSCFLKSFFEKQNCNLNTDEQEYLNQLAKAYVLGREQILKEQYEENNKFQAFINENLLEKQNEFDDSSSLIFDTNNNNQSITPVSPSSILFYNNIPKSDEHSSSIPPIKSNDSTISLNRQQSFISPGVITVKHQVFINEPIAMKRTNVLPGIGIKYAQQLAECGFSTVRRLLGFYLMIKDDQNFVNWLNDTAEISIHSAWLCTNALRSWCHAHL